MTPMIAVEGLTKSYRGALALDRLTLEIPEGLQGLYPRLAGLEAKGQLADISANGLGVLVGVDVEAMGFAAVDEVEAHLCLPTSGKPLRLSDNQFMFRNVKVTGRR